jgi:selenocysteine lyase/cysteine desulfurase
MLPSQRHLFDIPREVAWLNAASMTPLPRAVRAAGEAGVAAKTAPWGRAPDLVATLDGRVRAGAAALLGAKVVDIAITGAVSYGIATAARNLPLAPGARILLMAGEHPSHALAWTALAARAGGVIDSVARPADGDWTAAVLAAVADPARPPLGIAALTPLHWTDGSLLDLPTVADAVRDAGAALVVDATQAVGVLDVDVGRLAPDFLAFPTYKWLLGGYGLAFLYAAPHRQGGVPIEAHQGAYHEARLVDGARRYDRGELGDPVALGMAAAGMDVLRGWDRAALVGRLRHLTAALAEAAAEAGFTALPARLRPPHILGLRPPPAIAVGDVVAALADAGVHAAERGDVLRLGVHAYNDEADVARFADALRRAVR